MDVKTYASILRENAEYVRTLVSGLEARLEALEKDANGGNVRGYADACALVGEIAAGSERLSTAAEVFKARIQALKLKCEAGHDPSQATP